MLLTIGQFLSQNMVFPPIYRVLLRYTGAFLESAGCTKTGGYMGVISGACAL